mmetsp:Transcript_41357/g.74371  ORF Transcript_41357/g.74371 Transcript_41357/m.74371 type:complete len:281 (-) Transcript_41357:156-998(-)
MARLVSASSLSAVLPQSSAEPRRRTTSASASNAANPATRRLPHFERLHDRSKRSTVVTSAAKRAGRKTAPKEPLPEYETSDVCPCGTGLSYEACCEPYHYGDKVAETPETLMRSRYSAFAKRETNYINTTMHPSHPEIKGISEIKMIQDISSTAKGCSFHKLAVLGSKAGGSEDEATVSFRLWFKFVQWKGRKAIQDKEWQTLSETSTFKKEDGRWLYLSGVEDFTPMPYGDTSPIKKAPSTEGLAEKAKELDEKAKEMFSMNSVTEGMKSVFGNKAPKK